MLCGSGHYKTGLTRCKVGLHYFKIPLILFDFDHEMGDVIIDLPVPCDFLCQAPIIGVGHSGLEYMEVATRTGEHVLEPCR
jgi:hypothetical protein